MTDIVTGGMSDKSPPSNIDLRTRIAAALKKADEAQAPWAGPVSYDVLADAVIAELQLDKEFGCPVAGHHFCRCSHRHTTKWESNDAN